MIIVFNKVAPREVSEITPHTWLQFLVKRCTYSAWRKGDLTYFTWKEDNLSADSDSEPLSD